MDKAWADFDRIVTEAGKDPEIQWHMEYYRAIIRGRCPDKQKLCKSSHIH